VYFYFIFFVKRFEMQLLKGQKNKVYYCCYSDSTLKTKPTIANIGISKVLLMLTRLKYYKTITLMK